MLELIIRGDLFQVCHPFGKLRAGLSRIWRERPPAHVSVLFALDWLFSDDLAKKHCIEA
jgi:hypothetical protein